ncbi:BON domain-containing protein [Alteromonas gilva]|uniref:BON domain-containing protein n=1 Tax=Alteromonas gilva TaxID=2987522 RepID=A0ABT5L671_9ALTE|nr:BON domain-containing protein [Alteromonas gilva]MDC8832563.1 BON domain-containing protein [Alteromonas gilva]
MSIKYIKRSIVALLTLALLNGLSGCAVVAVGAVGATAVSVSNDRRTAGTQLDDFNARRKAAGLISQDEKISANSNIEITLYNRVALLTGQAPDQTTIQQAESLVNSVDYIRKIHNQIRVGKPIPATSVLHDKWLATKIRTKILASDNVPGSQITIIVEDSEVFLMGLVTNQEATAAVDIARHVDGVAKVVRAFEIY